MDSNTNNSSSNASSVFIEHVKQAFSTIPPITKFILFIPFASLIIDTLIFPLLNLHTTIASWLYLDYDKTVLGLQAFRFILYPFATVPLIQTIITPLWLIPETYKLERKTGSLKFLWILMTVFTFLPGVAYVFLMKAMTINWFNQPSVIFVDFVFKGMTGWVVGLIFWSYLQEDSNEEQDRMIAGAIRVPRKYWPLFVFIFFIFLVPDSSFLLNIMAAITGSLYVKNKLQFLVPSDEKFAEFEAKPWLRFLTESSNYVSMDSAGNSYLPIFNPARNSAASPSHTHNQPPTNSPPGHFPGQGFRLGSS